MSKKANPVLIGVFVLVGMFLLVASLILFGAGQYFQPIDNFIMYFDGSVKGLKVGAPVTFRGVQIGSVSEVRLIINQENKTLSVPVVVNFEKNRVFRDGEEKYKDGEFVEVLILMGMRAQLQTQSLLTGLLSVNLDFFPDTPIRLVDKEKQYTEIPTVPSTIEEISKAVENLPLASMMDELRGLIRTANNLLSDKKGGEIIDNANQAIQRIGDFIDRAEILVQEASDKIDPVADSLIQATKSFEGTSGEAGRSLKELTEIVSEDSNVRYELVEFLKEMKLTLRSLRTITDYLERNPNALITGKKADKK